MNELTPEQIERFSYLAEELAEVIQVIGKIMRHGLNSKNPENPDHRSNKDDLETELADVYFAVQLLADNNDLSLQRMMTYAMAKEQEPRKYFHYKENQ